MDQGTEHAAIASAASHTPSQRGDHRLFAGGGDTGALLAKINWAETSLGPVETWPQALRTSVRICLTSRHAILVWWGPDLVMFHNDAYAPTLDIKRTWAAGKPGREVWSEIWDTIGPMLEGVLRTGEPTWSDDQQLFLERSGYLEETYHTYSYSPIEDDTGTVVGVFTAVTETTQRVLSERRTQLARDLAAALVDARSSHDVCARAARVLASDPADIPFALLYGLDANTGRATLLDAAGLTPGSLFSPRTVQTDPRPQAHHAEKPFEPGNDPWSVLSVAHSGQELLIRDIAWDDALPAVERVLLPHDAMVLPLIEPGQPVPTAILVAGVSRRRALDAEYRAFYSVLAGHLSTALAAAHAYEEERKRAEALAEIDRAKTAFFSNVSHEFRTPLTLMLGPLEDSLADVDQPLPLAHRERLEVMRRNGVRLLKLVNTLLDFARIEAGRVQAVYEPTDLATYTAELASSFRSLIEKAGMHLVVECLPLTNCDDYVYVDRGMWEKIVLNLLSNAFKFTLEGTIAVAIRPLDEGRAVELMVRDTGVGIPATELPRLFERFHRVEGVRARTQEGSGIGLALVQELVHLHGGTIRVESGEGTGTTFFVRVPVAADHLPADRIQPALPTTTRPSTALGAAAFIEEAGRWLPGDTSGELEGVWPTDNVVSASALGASLDSGRQIARRVQNGTPARILLADDNSDMREYLRRLLSERYSVETVANGAQALEAIRHDAQALPDLVLTDVMMPELDGFGLLRALRSDPHTASLPVMMLSARAGEEATIEGLQAGADDYLVKPFSAREVLSRVEARLEIARSRAEAERRMHEALDAVLELARQIIAVEPSRGISSTARALTGLARKVVGSEIVSLLGVDDMRGFMQPLATVGRTTEDESAWYTGMGRFRPEAFYGAEEMRRLCTGEVVVVNVTSNTARGLPAFGSGSVATAPLIADGTLRGILSFAYAQADHQYGTAELELAAGFARMALLVLERERLVREREAARSEALVLAESTRRMDEFLGIASHELRTPLTTITANVQLASKQLHTLIGGQAASASDGRQARLERSAMLLARTSRQLTRLDRLVGDLLDTSRIQAGKLELRPEPCDLAEIVTEAVQGQRAAWPRRSITVELPRHRTVWLSADADRIGQVVTNYLTNALKYSPEQQPVAIRVLPQPDRVRVEVRDSGPGLSAGQQAHLFERFYRVPGVAQQSGSGVGLGLGLHICRSIIERHGGVVGVESTVGQGSTFWFELPLQQSAHID